MIDWDEPGVDLRSDTITQPTAAMRRAMTEARVGDDVLGDDPTVQELEALAARTLGKEAALFVPSGTMGNQVAVLTHTQRRGEVLLEALCHIYNHESGAFALVSGVSVRPVPTPRGVLTPADVAANVREADIHLPQTSLVAIENTHGDHSGTFWTAKEVAAVTEAVHDLGLPLHCDGARVFNAASAQNVAASKLVAGCDSVMFCVSKGLSAPVGSLVVGRREFIEKARWARKVLGGGMRQAGILAAAGIIAVKEMAGRLTEDHAHAKRLAEGLAAMDGYAIDVEACPTNIVILDTTPSGRTADEIAEAVGTQGVKVLAMGPHRVRAVTHRHITREDVERALEAFGKANRA